MENALLREPEPKLTYEHDCPYVEKLGEYAARLAQSPTPDDMTRSLGALIEIYHRDNQCPPTHDDRNLPTAEWADFVETARFY